LQQRKSEIVIDKDLENMQHRPKAWDRQTKAGIHVLKRTWLLWMKW